MAKGTIQQAADKQVAQAPVLRTREVVRKVKSEVTDAERDQQANKLAEAALNVTMLEAQRTEYVSDINRRIKKQKGVIEDAALIVQDGIREREVRCIQEFDDAKGLTRVIRKDTKEEIEEWRPMTDSEKQLAMPGTDDDPEGEDEGGDQDPEGVNIG